jgi:hypothetical protein
VVSAVDDRSISEVTRRDVLDFLSAEGISWSGRLEEVAFLERLWDLSALPSTDGRFTDASGDIRQHRVNNPSDWPDDWLFSDDRFDLSRSPMMSSAGSSRRPCIRLCAQIPTPCGAWRNPGPSGASAPHRP